MEPIPSNEILKNVKTRYEYEIIMSEIDDLQQSLFKTKLKSFEELLKTVSAYTSTVIRDVALSHEVSLSNRDSTKELLHNIKEALKDGKFVRLTVAFEPDAEFVNKLHEWVAQNLGKGLVLDIKTDNDIIGGIILIHEGRYIDKSLVKLFEKKAEELRDEISTFQAEGK